MPQHVFANNIGIQAKILRCQSSSRPTSLVTHQHVNINQANSSIYG